MLALFRTLRLPLHQGNVPFMRDKDKNLGGGKKILEVENVNVSGNEAITSPRQEIKFSLVQFLIPRDRQAALPEVNFV